MDVIIEKYDFKKADEKSKDKMKDELGDWAYEKMDVTANTKMALKALEVLQKKVCVADFPTLESCGGEMATNAFSTIAECIDTLNSDEKSKPKDFHQPLFEFIMKLIGAGPGSTHLELIYEVYRVDEMDEYTHSLKGDALKRLLAVCKRAYRPGKEKISFDDYEDKVLTGMSCVLNEGLADEQCQEHRSEVLDLYLYFRYGFLDRKEEERKMMSEMADWISDHLEGNPFQGIKDKTVYSKFFKLLREIIFAKSFPVNDEALDLMDSALKKVFDALDEDGTLKDACEELMDFTADLFSQKAGKKVHKLVERIGHYFNHVEERHIKGNGKMFEYVCKKLTTMVEEYKDPSFFEVTFVDALMSEVLVKSMSNSPAHVELVIKLIKVLLKRPVLTMLDAAISAVSQTEKALKWKEHIPAAKDIFVIISTVKIPDGDNQEEVIGKYKEFTECFLDQIKTARILQELNEALVMFAIGVVESKNEALYALASEVADRTEFDSKKNKSLLMTVFRRFDPILKDKRYPWFENYDLSSLVTGLLTSAYQGVKNANHLDESDYKVVLSILQTVVVEDFIHQETGEVGSIFYNIFSSIGSSVLQNLVDINGIDWAKPLFGDLIGLLNHEVEDVRNIAGLALDLSCRKGAELLAPFMDKLVKTFFEHESSSLIQTISISYPSNPGPVNKEFQEFMKHYNSGDVMVKMFVLQLYVAVAKHHPEVFTEKNLQDLLKYAKQNEESTVQILMLMEDVAKKHPDKLGKLLPQLLDNKSIVGYAQPTLINVLKQIGLRSETHAEAILNHFAKTLDGPDDQTLMLCTLDGMRNVGGHHLPLLAKHKQLIERVKGKTKIQYTKDGCTGLIDIIEGRSLAGLAEDIKETQDDVEVLDSRVNKTETDVKVVSKEVKTQKKEINTVKKDVKTQGKKIEELDKTVDDTVAKVEEIDGKTLSHAPFWARDVSKLLNPKDEHDWRLLSSRLGYSNDDIRGWAQQHDPCMAMLNEWYATRKTSEATFAILTALQEMNRMDAAVIVENAMKMAETVVEDDPFEYATPPAVFLSYQWGIQNEVKLLKQHLEMAGYECWMDIGQMGGGDKLFEKIDQGIRAAKVIISCVTEKYAKSPNCNREVNLSVSLGRPMIPLLMEKQTWPPAGSMGPIFSEYLFIRFFTRPGEETRDQRYWSAAKFQELLMQLNYNGIVPDERKVQKQYKNWWIPVVEEIKLEKKKDGGKSGTQTTSTENTELAAVSPDVFISYQWGKQKQIMLLYRRLTGLGFTCWMDIYQMGGGDSLYDKIDRGVRGCKLVLTCVTTKYALSANCRREVSLADALKKPIIPLLLEKITWPPSGPMSMVFTQLLYINFSKDETIQEKWVGKEFDELLGKIKSNVPALGESQRNKDTQDSKNSNKDEKKDKPETKTAREDSKHSPSTKSSAKSEQTTQAKEKDTEQVAPNPKLKPQNQEQTSKSCILL